MPANTALGRSVPRREGWAKLTGRELYVDDLPRDGVWLGATIRARGPHSRVTGIARDPAFPWDSVVFATAADIPGRNVLRLLVDDQPALADGVVRHAAEAVALIAAPDAETLAKAKRAITVHEELLPQVLDPEASSHDYKRIEIVRGDAARAMRSTDIVFEGEYRFGSQEHIYIETQGMQAEWTSAGVVIRGSMQCPYYVVHGLAPLLGLPEAAVRVIQCATGGGFGGKEEYPTMIAAHAAILAREAGRPVRIVYDRAEDMLATTKRHPGRVRFRTGLGKDGRIVAMEADVLLDGGAYCTLSPVVLSRGAIHAAGPYDVPDVRVLARVVATNHPPFGAFRGFGAPQTIFAREVHLDECAARVGLDPADFRRRNVLRRGGVLSTGQNVGDDVAAEEVLERALDESRYAERREEFAAFNRREPFRRRGIGLSLFHHGAGFTGSGEVVLASTAGLRGNADGTVTVLSSQTEIGQGTRTILAQAAAEGLGVPVELVLTEDPDTASMPDSGPTVASRTGMVIGGLLVRAGRELREKLERDAGRALDVDGVRDTIARAAAGGPLVHTVRYRPPAGNRWDEEHYRGDAYATYAWSCQVAAVEADVLTGETRVLDVTSVQEVGRVMNPVLAAGQIEGGVAQGVGWALLEHVAWKDGAMANATMTDYSVPTAKDTPPIRTVFVERTNPRAPHGAKGLGELPMDGPAPAIVNALNRALGTELRSVPATPEIVLPAIEAREAAS
ncbi:MAG: xanthine dehydrogenase family protein molybdopterin-binding subunit [Candidatus Eiseniibacteriota bacterium]